MNDDLIIKNVRVVRPGAAAPLEADIAVKGGNFSRIAPNLPAGEAKSVYDGRGRLAFPGVVDAHMHTGIYAPLEEDAVSESRAAAQGRHMKLSQHPHHIDRHAGFSQQCQVLLLKRPFPVMLFLAGNISRDGILL